MVDGAQHGVCERNHLIWNLDTSSRKNAEEGSKGGCLN